MRVLVLLWTGEPLNLSTVADGLGVNSSNASRTCDRLGTAGFVDRGELATDRRYVALTLTEHGRNLVKELMERRQRELALIMDRMSEPDRRRLMAALEPFHRQRTPTCGLAAAPLQHATLGSWSGASDRRRQRRLPRTGCAHIHSCREVARALTSASLQKPVRLR